MTTFIDPNTPVTFNPNLPMFDFEARKQAITDKKRMAAEALKRAMQQSEGQMVSGHYVRPHWSAAVTQGLLGAMALREQGKLQADEAQYAKDEQAAAAAHVASRPLANVPADGVGPVQEPSIQDRLTWAQQGLTIPSRRGVLEKLIDDLEVNEPTRIESRQVRAAEKAQQADFQQQQLAQAADLKREQLKQQADIAAMQAANTKLSIEERAIASKRHDDLMRELAAGRNAAAANKAAAGKVLPQSAIKDIGDLENSVGTITRLQSEFKPEYANLKGAAATIASNWIPGVETEAGNWWKNYRKEQAIVERHNMFGSALTATEKSAWNDADISPSMNDKTIAKNLARRAELADKVYRAAAARQQASGYNAQAVFPGAFETPSASAPTAEATKTIGGVTYVKRGGQWYAQ